MGVGERKWLVGSLDGGMQVRGIIPQILSGRVGSKVGEILTRSSDGAGLGRGR